MLFGRLSCLALFVLASFVSGSAFAKTHALVVGINGYATHGQLKGALNDARDLEQVLRKVADGQVVALMEEQATRANFLSAWAKLRDGARSGDTVIITFAGHGAQIADQGDTRDEPDGSDEVLLFQPFDEGKNFGEKLLDDEIFSLFEEAEKRGFTMLFVMDACHSGGLARSIARQDIAASALPTRFTRFKTKPSHNPVPKDFKAPPVELGKRTVFISATHERLKVQEVLIDGKPRGALSYVLARGLEGSADIDNDGLITARELENYVKPNVREAAQNRQVPELLTGDPEARLLAVSADPVSSDIAPLPVVSLSVQGTTSEPQIDGAQLVDDIAAADVVWDEVAGQLMNQHGDVLSLGVKGDGLPYAVGAQRLRKFLLGLRERGNLFSVDLLPDDRLYRTGDVVTFKADSLPHKHITIFNVAGNGAIQFLYPRADQNDSLDWPEGRPWEVQSSIQAPYGSDFVVLISSKKPLFDLHRKLVSLHCRKAATAVYHALAESLPSTDYEIGLKSIFTEKKANADAEEACY